MPASNSNNFQIYLVTTILVEEDLPNKSVLQEDLHQAAVF